MIHKVAYISNGIFQVGDNPVPLDEESLQKLAQSLASMEEVQVKNWIEQIKQTKEGSLEEKTAEKGVIVDMYEVDYPTPVDPMKQTEELASHLDEKRDFVMQHVFPETETTDVIVGLRQDILKEKPTEAPVPKESSKKNWRKVLSWQEEFSFPEQETEITLQQLLELRPEWERWLPSTKRLSFLKLSSIKVSTVPSSKERHLSLFFLSPEFEYFIGCTLPSNRDKKGYMGCIVTERQGRRRGNDLEDGEYSNSTWNRILRDIKEYETRTGRWKQEEEGIFW